MYLEKFRHKVVVKGALYVFLITLGATVFRPLFVDQTIIFTYIGIINSLVFGCLFLYLRRAKPANWHAIFFLFSGLALTYPLVFFSGGIDSQFIYILPIAPIFLAIVSTARYTYILTIFMLISVVAMVFGSQYFPDLAQDSSYVQSDKIVAKGFWLCASIVLAALAGLEFSRVNVALGDKLFKQAETDPLTGIFNRRALLDVAEQLCARRIPFCLMLVDLDFFKRINDDHGHIVGDDCLKMVAVALQNSIRKESDVVGRYGGEEFIVIIDNASAEQGIAKAESIRKTIESLTVEIISKKTVHLSATIGLACAERHSQKTIMELINTADKALYEGKKRGRNRVCQL